MGYVAKQPHAFHVKKYVHIYIVNKFAYCTFYVAKCKYFKINKFKKNRISSIMAVFKKIKIPWYTIKCKSLLLLYITIIYHFSHKNNCPDLIETH